MSQRTERIDELLRQEIGQALVRELADPAIGFATVTQVETSPDLRHARVWFSVIGSAEERASTLAALRRAMPYIRRELGPRLRLKRIPEFHVQLDESMERGTRVLHIIQGLEEGRAPEDVDAATGPEPLPTPVPRLPHEGDAAAGSDGVVLPGVGSEPTPGTPVRPVRRPHHAAWQPGQPGRLPGGRRVGSQRPRRGA
ncbi:MAG: 30S ribosome-binding factor RbfA [Candidatus Limnocylindrales bacterium]